MSTTKIVIEKLCDNVIDIVKDNNIPQEQIKAISMILGMVIVMSETIDNNLVQKPKIRRKRRTKEEINAEKAKLEYKNGQSLHK